MNWVVDRFRRQDAHSLYATFAALLLGLTIVVDLVFHTHLEDRWISWLLLIFCLSCSLASFLTGRRMPRWIGFAGVLVFVGAESYYLSLADDPQSVISSVQQLPIVAFYLGWFVAPRFAIPLVSLCLFCFGFVMASNPLLQRDGEIGVPVAVHGLLTLVFCYTVGYYLWRRQSRAAMIDSLTGAFTRSGLIERLEQELRRTARRRPCAVVAIDFDGLKALNDREGHAAGDAALNRTVMSWSTGLRDGDVIGRTGGDEFVLLLPRTTADEARSIVARLRGDEDHSWSWGVVQARPGETPDAVLARADRALYAHKHARNGGGRG